MSGLFERISARQLHLAIVIGSLLLVITWHLVATREKPRLDKIAAELVATKEFDGTPRPNHAGTKLLYVETIAHGTAAYLVDLAGGQTKPLNNATSVPFLGWSPDDSLFAYLQGAPDNKIAISDGTSAKTLATLPESKKVSEGVWLSNEALIYVNSSQELTLIRKLDNDWHKSKLFAAKPAGETNPPVRAVATARAPATRVETVQCLTAISEKSVAWQQGKTIWLYELGADAPAKVWEATTNTLLNFTFAGDRQALRLHARNARSEFLFDLYPAFVWREDRLANFELIKPVIGPQVLNLAFIQNGLGYAYLAHGQTNDGIVIQSGSNSAPVQLTWDAGVDSFAVNDNHVYIVGSPTNGPLNIWDYEVKSGALSCAVAGVERPFQYAKTVAPTHQTTTTAAGKHVLYFLWPPADLVAGKKYPLVIMFNGLRWRPQEGSVPAAESFLVSSSGMPSDMEDVIAIYQAVIQNPAVDTRRVYLLGSSSSATIAGRLLEARPDLWHGAVLLSPLYFPNVSQLKVSRILIDSGMGDEYLKQQGGTNLLIKFQNAAALAGIPVTLSLNSSAGHIYRSKTALGHRVQQTLEFVAADK